MLILAFDTAAAPCAACIFDADAGTVLAQACEEIGTGHAERLMPMIDDVLAQAGVPLARISAIACSVGPGSFTGVRVGVAAARGFMQALGVPGIGVSTLAALAADALPLAGGRPVRVLIDARRGEVHAQDFTAGGETCGEAALLSLEQAAACADDVMLAGSGAHLAAPGRAAVLEARATGAVATFARLAAARRQTSLTMSPLYLRGADAKPQDGFALARR